MISPRLVGLALLCLPAFAARAETSPPNDLRNLRVGMSAAELPQTGYADFACTDGGQSLTKWRQWRECQVNAAGLRGIAFHYDDTPDHETIVAGQPVMLSLAIGEDGVVQSLTMRSDPSGRVFLRKRGVHFGERVMNHYGAEGWRCNDGEPAAGEEAVGSIFIRQHCEKTVGARHLVVDRSLFRRAGQPQDKFVSQSTFTVSLVSPRAP